MNDTVLSGRNDFDRLLDLLSAERETAGEAYEEVRQGLIRFFTYRGCNDPESLADETFERVSRRSGDYDPEVCATPRHFVLGFARNIVLEQRRSRESQLEPEDLACVATSPSDNDSRERAGACLTKCLEGLSTDERNLILDYYRHEGAEKIKLRRRLAAEAGCSADALYTRIFRLKARLRTCVQGCLGL